MKKSDILLLVIVINLLIFSIANIFFNIKYEQVDDFIIYNLYSGLDGTYNFHGVYIHPILCILIGLFFRIAPQINWHTIFLLLMQFICFTTIGYIILQKHKTPLSILIYTIFASIFYTALLLLIQYTSVAALLILTAFFITIDNIENKNKKWTILAGVLYAIGIMTRMQSLLIIVPFMGIYLLYYLVKYKLQGQTVNLIKQYAIYIIITIIVYVSNMVIYSVEPYKQYMKYNDLRAQLHDLSYTSYNNNKEIFDKIGWSKNDHYLFYTFNTGDENVYNKQNLQKIIDYKKQQGNYYNLNLELDKIATNFKDNLVNTNTFIAIMFFSIIIISILNSKNRNLNILIALTTMAVHILFIVLNRSMLRVVIPEYILGTALIIYNLNLEETKKYSLKIIAVTTILISIIGVNISGTKYNYGYNINYYSNYKQLINYTNSHKENVYLYTVPALQYRYYVYSVYEMPPKSAFSNLRVMGGWDMYTQNYYDFKARYNLDGTFLDLLKENVYLIDGDVTWSGRKYSNYIDKIVLFIKEHYNIDVKYERVNTFDNLYIYKLERI
jgi:4-amino-4-deoxy-L-arabinose transferase-like glycosyltransferase